MATIQKRADELKPGDVVTLGAHGKASLLYFSRDPNVDMVRMQFGAHNGKGLVTLDVDPEHDTVFRVESPDLTPAQQHAEEMLELLRDVQARAVDPMALIPQRIAVLLDKIKPPEPPTLVEALKALADVVEHSPYRDRTGEVRQEVEQACQIVDRARRAGLL